MTESQLEAVVNGLVEIVDSWNSAAAGEDPSGSNYALCLTLWDDGSGQIAQRDFGNPEPEGVHEFRTFEELVEILRDGEGVEFEKEE